MEDKTTMCEECKAREATQVLCHTDNHGQPCEKVIVLVCDECGHTHKAEWDALTAQYSQEGMRGEDVDRHRCSRLRIYPFTAEMHTMNAKEIAYAIGEAGPISVRGFGMQVFGRGYKHWDDPEYFMGGVYFCPQCRIAQSLTPGTCAHCDGIVLVQSVDRAVESEPQSTGGAHIDW